MTPTHPRKIRENLRLRLSEYKFYHFQLRMVSQLILQLIKKISKLIYVEMFLFKVTLFSLLMNLELIIFD